MEGGRGGGRGKGKKAKKKAAKKVAANNAQVVAVSTVQETPAPTNGEPTMTKSKRKRLKKQAAEALKASQQAKSSPTSKTNVAVLTPPSTAVKPHVVSLTGAKKKKKRKKSEVSGEMTGVIVPNEGQVTEVIKSPKKTVVVLGHTPIATVKTKAVSPVAASPRKSVKKVKMKTTVASSEIESKDVAAKEEVVNKNTEKKSDNVERFPKSKVTTASTKATKPTPKRKIAQVEGLVKKAPALQTNQVQASEKNADLPTSEEAPTQNVTPKKKTIVNAVGIESTESSAAKQASSGPETFATITAPTIYAKMAPVPATVAVNASSKPVPASVTTATPPKVIATKLAPSPLTKANVSDTANLPKGGIKRRRSTDHTSAKSVAESLQPPAKRKATASGVGVNQSKAVQQTGSDDKQEGSQDLVSNPRIQRTATTIKQAEPPVSDKATHVLARADVVATAPSVKAPLTSSQPAAGAFEGKADWKESVNQYPHTTQSAGKRSLKSVPERKSTSQHIQAATSKEILSKAKQPKSKVKTEVVTSTADSKKDADSNSTTGVASEHAAKPKKVGIVMDSHAYVKKMMRGELETSKLGKNGDKRPAQRTVTLPPRPQNAWGASFGMVPPAQSASSTSRTLTTTPLSSWFLSKGCANFVKEVHFSDDDSDGRSDDDGGVSTRLIATPRGIDKASPKRRTSVAKKNAFLESLTTQSNWRTWYGKVDVDNLLDPPLAHVPENLRTHEVTPLALPDPSTEMQTSALTKKTSELEMLEADIRREKQRGSAFSEQLLMMLQGKTVSGKLLEEEYRPLLQY